jgi:hypothetical protein
MATGSHARRSCGNLPSGNSAATLPSRNVAHTRGMDRLYVRGLANLALPILTLYGAGKPKAAYDRRGELVSAILSLLFGAHRVVPTFERSARLKQSDLGAGCQVSIQACPRSNIPDGFEPQGLDA